MKKMELWPVLAHHTISNDTALFPGMYVKALIETQSENIPALPIEAVIQSEGKSYIFIQADTAQSKTIFKIMPVIKGIEEEGFAAITLPEGFIINSNKIIVKGGYALLSTMKNVEEESIKNNIV
jgi:cobalt-zinc-cadmium efflux system membrane fusion protein